MTLQVKHSWSLQMRTLQALTSSFYSRSKLSQCWLVSQIRLRAQVRSQQPISMHKTNKSWIQSSNCRSITLSTLHTLSRMTPRAALVPPQLQRSLCPRKQRLVLPFQSQWSAPLTFYIMVQLESIFIRCKMKFYRQKMAALFSLGNKTNKNLSMIS